MTGRDLRDFATCDPPWLILKGRLFGSPDPAAVLSLDAPASEITRELLEIRRCDLADEPTWRQWPKRFWPLTAQRGDACVPGVVVFVARNDAQEVSLCHASAEFEIDLADVSSVDQAAQLIEEHFRSKLVSDLPQATLDC